MHETVVNVIGCNFIQNQANPPGEVIAKGIGSGGAIAITDDSSSGSFFNAIKVALTLTNCLFNGNIAQIGINFLRLITLYYY